MAKLDKAVVIYMPSIVNARPKDGFKCGGCIMGVSDTSECTILTPPEIDLEHGICTLYVPGKNITSEDKYPLMEILPRDMAGYSEDGPTYCGICNHFISPNGCLKVNGHIDRYGCCNGWERE